MSDTKISALTALSGANVDTAADVLAIVDTSATATKKILVDELRNAIGPVSGTEQVTTSGTAIDFISIPSWVKKITVMFDGVSTNGTSVPIVQIGDSGGIEALSYNSTASSFGAGVSSADFTTGFALIDTWAASNALYGQLILTLQDTSNTWVASGIFKRAASGTCITGGSKATSATLDRIRLTTVGGTDTFDSGAVNVLYE